ncbi:MAG: hypothetical protein LC687_04855 [Actinobacteria bacterium]|nr:hypothetical protein [Actinomycetota bacterium]
MYTKSLSYIIPDQSYVSRTEREGPDFKHTYYLLNPTLKYLGPIGTAYIPSTRTIQLTLFVPRMSEREKWKDQFKGYDGDHGAILPGGALIDLIIPGEILRPYSIASHYPAYMMQPEALEGIPGHIYVLYIRDVDGAQSTFFRELIMENGLQNPESGNYHYVDVHDAPYSMVPSPIEVRTEPYQMFPVNEHLIQHRKSSWDPKPKCEMVKGKSFYSTGTGIAPFLLYLQNLAEYVFSHSVHVGDVFTLPTTIFLPLEIVHSVKDDSEVPADTGQLGLMDTYATGYTYHALHLWSRLIRFIKAQWGPEALGDEHKLRILFTRQTDRDPKVLYSFEAEEHIDYIYQDENTNIQVYSQDLLRERMDSAEGTRTLIYT